jgi:hypothetical protein
LLAVYGITLAPAPAQAGAATAQTASLFVVPDTGVDEPEASDLKPPPDLERMH